jgi:GT2 family glycosyltransferase
LCEWVERLGDERVTLVRNAENRGFAGGMNSGLGSAGKRVSPDHIWLLNNDLTVAKDALQQLLIAARARPAVGIWGPTVVDARTDRVQCAGGCRYSPCLAIDHPAYAGKPLDELNGLGPPTMDYVYGAAMFVSGRLLREAGGLDEHYFLYFEELELARQAGGPAALGWCREAIVRHTGSKRPGRDRGLRVFSAYHASLSAFRYTARHHPLCLPSAIAARVGGLALQAIRERNGQLALAPWRALRDFTAGRCHRVPG